MKRILFGAWLGVVIWGLAGLGRIGAAESGAEPTVRGRFVGIDRLGEVDGATKLKEIIALPQTRAVGLHFLERLARASGQFMPGETTGLQQGEAADLVRPLFESVVRRESWLEVRGAPGSELNWVLGVKVPDEEVGLWRKNLERLAGLNGLGKPEETASEGVTSVRVKNGSGEIVLRWARIGDWFLVGVGKEPMELWRRSLAERGRSNQAGSAAEGEFVKLEMDLRRWAGPLGLAEGETWPRISFALSGRGDDVRTTMHLKFKEAVTGKLSAWQVPTNTIREPLISFSAWRGVQPLLSRLDVVKELGLNPAPNEIYVWSQNLIGPQTLWAFPADDPEAQVKAIWKGGLSLIPASWKERGLGQLEWLEEQRQLVWKSLPLLPHLHPGEDGGRGFVMGGFFPTMQSTNPPPSDLLEQFIGRENLVGYSWEITSQRLTQLRLQVQLGALVARKSILSSNAPALPWMDAMGEHLGNSATEVVAESPREWSVLRRSQAGLTASELMTLICWLESTDFPKLTFRLPELTVKEPEKKPQPKRVR